MRKELIALAGLAALVLAGIVVVSLKATTTTNAASTEIYGIDIFGITRNAKDLPVQEFAAH